MIRLRQEQIENWVAAHFEYKKRSKGQQLVINNPFDGDDGWHFWIATYPDKLKKGPGKGKTDYWVHDFRPGVWSGSFLRFVKEYKNISYHDAAKEVTGESSSKIRDQLRKVRAEDVSDKDEPEEKLVELPKGSRSVADEDGSLARKVALGYLASRKITEEKAIRHFLHYTATSIIFPYLEYGILVYWQQRDILDKRFNFPDESECGVGKSDFLYGFDQVEPGSDVILLEAIIDAITVDNDALAIGGAEIGGKQVRKLKALNPRVVIISTDNDEAGFKALRKMYFELSSMFRLAYCIPPNPYKDWNELEKKKGIGFARTYIENNTYELNMAKLARLTIA